MLSTLYGDRIDLQRAPVSDQVAHVFLHESDDHETQSAMVAPQRPVDLFHCYPPLEKNGSDKNGE